MSNLFCFRTEHEIVNELAKGDSSGDGIRNLRRFLGRREGFGPGSTDKACSLIILRSEAGEGKKARFNADLLYTPAISHLPQIIRQGKYAPWMAGLQLGLEDHVTDPDLQRTQCLALTDLTGLEEALLYFVKSIGYLNAEAERRISAKASGERRVIIDDLANRAVARAAGAVGLAIPLGDPGFANAISEAVLNWDVKIPQKMIEHFVAARDRYFSRIKLDINEVVARYSARIGPKDVRIDLDGAPLTKLHLEWVAKIVSAGNYSTAADMPERAAEFLTAFLFNLRNQIRSGAHLGFRRFLGSAFIDSTRFVNYVVQGVGDLSMNQWNVAFLNSTAKAEVVIPENEPFTNRSYTCLVKLKRSLEEETKRQLIKHVCSLGSQGRGICLGEDLILTELKIMPGFPYVHLPATRGEQGNHGMSAALHKLNNELHEAIDFAVYGKLVLRGSEVIPVADVIDEFQDLRHVFRLANLNDRSFSRKPEEELTEGLKKRLSEAYERDKAGVLDSDGMKERVQSWSMQKERYLFGQLQSADVWLLEHALSSDVNLRCLACTSKISVGLSQLGAMLPWVHFCLLNSGYVAVSDKNEVNAEGLFSWDWSDRSDPRLVVHLKRNCYPCTMIGIGQFGLRAATVDNSLANSLYLLAWGHDYPQDGSTIWHCAELLKSLGAEYALVVDEGQDVFQAYFEDHKSRDDFIAKTKVADVAGARQHLPVPITFGSDGLTSRRSMRASIAFWQETIG